MYPGYSNLKQYAQPVFLMTALAFAALVNIFLIANFYWSALLTAGQRNLCLAGLLGAWIILTVFASYWKHRIMLNNTAEEDDVTFRQALCDYLRGHWYAAESQILPYLKRYPKDIEMLLLQATMYRHTERYEEALLVLDKLQLLEGSRRWHLEIAEERRACTRLTEAG